MSLNLLTWLLPWYLTFWFFEAPAKLFGIIWKFIKALEHLLSLSLAIKTFFAPWKNERRPGYYLYAIGIGVAVRFWLIILDLILLGVVLTLGTLAIFFFVLLPVISLILIFFNPF